MAQEAAIEEAVEATVVEDPPTRSTELVAHEAPRLTVAPQVQAEELGLRLAVIKAAMENEMIEGVDYGKIPGTNKPTLLKPGAEKLSVMFQLDVQLLNEKHYDGTHLTVTSHATVFHAPTGTRLGYGEGLCTTRERKYAYRNAKRVCPECNTPAIIKGKQEFGGGWICFRKQDGCGEKFVDDDRRITTQEVGEIDNPDLPDLWNTVIKMGEKRARVDAVLAVTGASALFTQDVEDHATPDAEAVAPTVEGPEYGRDVSEQLLPHAKGAVIKIAGGEEAGKALWAKVKGQLGTANLPHAAAVALVIAAGAMTSVPFDPEYEGSDDVPSETEVTLEREAREVKQLEDEAFELWKQLESDSKAAKRVSDAQGSPAVLKVLVDTARRTKAQKDRVTA